MSITTWAKKNSRAMGKIGLYGVGGIMIGWPAIKFGTSLFNGASVENAAKIAVWEGTGYSMDQNYLSTPALRNAALRTGVGAAAILLARKL